MIGHADGVGAGRHRDLGVIDVEDALEDELAGPQALDPFDVLPIQGRVELVRGPGGQRFDVGGVLGVTSQVAEGLALALQDRPGPGRLGHDVENVLKLDLRRHGQSVAHVDVALAEHLQIDGQHQRAAFRCRRALDQLANEAAVAHHIELEPERLVDRRRHVLDRIDRHGGQRVGNAGRLRRAAGHDLAVAVHHAAEPDRPERERHRHRFTQDGRRGAALVDVAQDALTQLDLLEIGAVGAQRLLVVGARVGVIEEHFRDVAARALPQVIDAGKCLHGETIRLEHRLGTALPIA